VVLEVKLPDNPAELQPMIMKYAVDPKGKTLSQKLSPEVKSKLDKELSGMGLPPQALDPLEPWFVSMTLTQLGARSSASRRNMGRKRFLPGLPARSRRN
jgi:uncharacterized protein YbaP (TraB family)